MTRCRCRTGCWRPQPLVKLGAMAYSLYLWHWPLLIFWLAYTGHRHANFFEGTAVLLISGVLAYLTTRFVEDPLRHRAPASAAPESRPGHPLAGAAASPHHGAGIDGGAAGCDAHRDRVHLASSTSTCSAPAARS